MGALLLISINFCITVFIIIFFTNIYFEISNIILLFVYFLIISSNIFHIISSIKHSITELPENFKNNFNEILKKSPKTIKDFSDSFLETSLRYRII
jgi:hypothetical protein